ncbi:MAG: GspH/FimT family pseudopilin [Pseudomonadota bacterium]
MHRTAPATATRPTSTCDGPYSRQSGFTVIELMVTIAVAGIILALAVPSFQSSIASNRLVAATNQMVSALNQAKSEALRRNARAVLCKDDGSGQCSTASGPWSNGWIVFVDVAPFGSPTPAIATGDITIARGTLQGDLAVRGNGTAAQYIAFTPNGMTRNYASGATASVTLRVCSTSSSLSDDMRARDILVNSSGRIALASPHPSVNSGCPAP